MNKVQEPIETYNQVGLGFGNYVDTKVNQIKNIELPKISMPQTHPQTLGEKVGEGLDKFKHILPRPANSGLSNSLLNQ